MKDNLFKSSEYMQNRELSWLLFNERVLLQANRVETPLLERLKFISIFSNNLDEFFMIRVGSLTYSKLIDGKIGDDHTGMTAKEQLLAIFHAVTSLYTLSDDAYRAVMDSLKKRKIELISMSDVSDAELKKLRQYFTHNILSILSPSIIDPKHPFPHIQNKQLHIAVTIEKRKGSTFALIAVPSNTERLIFLDASRFVLLEDLVLHFASLVFANYQISEKCVIAVTRNADFDSAAELLDEDMDFRQHMKALLKKRQRLAPVRLEVSGSMSKEMLNFLCEKLTLKPSQVFRPKTPLDLSFGLTLHRHFDRQITTPLLWPAHIPAYSLPRADRADMLKRAYGGDILLSYPFDSMSAFLSMIRQAVDDLSVLSIKITLYRIDAQSKLIESLISAAENGKEIIVLMELRARFDESNNIEWANRLEDAGCRVIYGLVGYKCHAKVCLITRKDSDGEISYITQIGTGNYNELTAKLYTDLSLITSNQEIGKDAAAFFSNMLTDNLSGQYSHLWVAPNSFKSNMLSAIDNEIKKAASGGHGKITIKCNSLSDIDIINKLVDAGNSGVEVLMNIRGICCLVPGIAGITENIQAVSIVGRFLEHTRVFCFGVGDEEMIYISSADLMTRNTLRRVEIACPILDPSVKAQIRQMLDIIFSDNMDAWVLKEDGSYALRDFSDSDHQMSSQEKLRGDAESHAARLLAAESIAAAVAASAKENANATEKTPFLKRFFGSRG
ncbi:MAG: polyphosphate kinase 1 [Oscillospiraceae bacterium]|nr:polyphosphate kinase 1 [Oscillospiraceae bacterium]